MLTVKKIISYRLWLSAVLALVIALVIIPVVVISIAPDLMRNPKGINVKSGDSIFYGFLEEIKEQGGVLVLGTSETGNEMSGNNYFHLLDRDQDLEQPFYSFGGAGRTSNVYFPLILNNPEAFRNLNIILYINPTYWRKGLNGFSEAYFDRYVDQRVVRNVKNKAIELGIYDGFMTPVDEGLFNIDFNLDLYIDYYRSIFNVDMMNILNPKQNKEHYKINLSEEFDSSRVNSIRNKIDLTYNVTPDYLKKNEPFPEIDTTINFQYDILKSFIKLTKAYSINCIFYLGPINQLYCEKMNPERLSLHLITVENIRTILKDNKVPFIDGTSLSTVPCTFIDIQHISEYGAYLTELQIKKYYENNK